ncbi:MAG: thioredoxin domain-containing protein [Alphaproteobacteria bacterium]
MPENALASETSPYLLQHKDNPVHWRPWGPEAFADAKQQGKPILLSVGYAACHWCHVMAHESFEDPDTAAVMNDGFVNIKVDREERPDVDSIYQSALSLIGEHGGWPLTMFLTPEGAPFWGGTYFPPTARFGRPAFRDLLKTVLEVYHREPDKVQRNAAALRDALDRMSRTRHGGDIPPGFPLDSARRLLAVVDPVHGGIGQAPKFPQVPMLELLWRGHKEGHDSNLRHAVLLTLDQMCLGGIYDHLGGGFARYSTDAYWLVPHFEKMLYDNAQLVDLLQLVWQDTRSPLYAARISETIAWMLREMRLPGGAFASSFDADSEGEEGVFYVWQAGEIDEVLGADAELFKTAYGVTPEGNWEGGTILNRRPPLFADQAVEESLARAREALRQRRETREKPARDDKVLADWNGLAITALARAGASFANRSWIAVAAEAFDFILAHMRTGSRLRHSWCRGSARHPATLDDHASLARGALALFEATSEPRFLAEAQGLAATADAHFWDRDAAGYFLTADDTVDLITRTKTAHDGAIPSGNGMMVEVLARLYHLTGKPEYAERARGAIAAFSGGIAENFFSLPTLLNASELLRGAVEIVLVGPSANREQHPLARAAFACSLPNRVMQMFPEKAGVPATHPAFGRSAIDGKMTAYVCRAGTCSLPITEPEALAAALAEYAASTSKG